jgi:hypothetical protein
MNESNAIKVNELLLTDGYQFLPRKRTKRAREEDAIGNGVLEEPPLQLSTTSGLDQNKLTSLIGAFVKDKTAKVVIERRNSWSYMMTIAGITSEISLSDIAVAFSNHEVNAYFLQGQYIFGDKGTLSLQFATQKPTRDAYRLSQLTVPLFQPGPDVPLLKLSLTDVKVQKDLPVSKENKLLMQAIYNYASSYEGDKTPKAVEMDILDEKTGRKPESLDCSSFRLMISGWHICSELQLATFKMMFPLHVTRTTVTNRHVCVYLRAYLNPLNAVWQSNPLFSD